ncbi:MAG TPA: hypothetical protein VMH27_02485 [Puia sp.]|nr:hypothetical protein [Puia sp.]
MAINQNHLFEELNGVKCAIVEKNVAPDRVAFLRRILEFNRFTVVVAPSPPPKAPAVAGAPAAAAASAAPAAAAAATSAAATDTAPAQPAPPPPALAESFTVGVTDVSFNPINAIFGRLLKAPGGHVVTLAYWKQQEDAPHDEKPYFEGK